MSRIWVDDDDDLTLPTDVRSLAWSLGFFAGGMGTLIMLPPTGAAYFLAAGVTGIAAGVVFLIRAVLT